MAAVEQIRRIFTEYESRGAGKAVADLNAVAGAQDKVAKTGDGMAKSTDTSARRQLSAATAYDRLRKSIDEGYRAQQNMARGQRVLDAALEHSTPPRRWRPSRRR